MGRFRVRGVKFDWNYPIQETLAILSFQRLQIYPTIGMWLSRSQVEQVSILAQVFDCYLANLGKLMSNFSPV